MPRFIYILSSLITLLLAACSSDHQIAPDPDPTDSDSLPIAFVAPVALPVSRADSPLSDIEQEFRIWTYKDTGSETQTVMNGYLVNYLTPSSSWLYSGIANPDITGGNQFLKYWDASASQYDFLAFAGTDGQPFTVTPTGFIFSNLPGNTTSAPNILVAKHRRDLSTLTDTDMLDPGFKMPTLSTFSDVVPLRFHHLYSTIEFVIFNSGDTDAYLSEAVVRSPSVPLIDQGTYTEDGWTSENDFYRIFDNIYTDSDPDGLFKVPKNGRRDTAIRLSGVFYEIPQDLPASLQVELHLHTSDSQSSPISLLVKDFSLDPTTWTPGTHYTYVIHLSIGNDTEPILIDVTCNRFLREDPQDFDETNW